MENKKIVGLKFVIIIAVASLILGALIMFLLNNFAFNKNKTVIGIKGYKLTKLDLYEKMKTSKYNSAIQKYFIQLKEIKDDLIYEQPNEFSEKENNSSLFSNFIENKNQEQVEELDDNINMIIVN